MKIKIKSGDDLNKLLDALAKDIVEANIYYRLSIGLSEATTKFSEEFNQSNTFWWLTINALQEAYLTRLCRVFDENDGSLNLVNLLDTINENIHFFQEPNFRERLKNNVFVNSLSENVRVPTALELQTDIQLVSDDNPVVSKLTLWRNNVHAHKGSKLALGQAAVVEENKIEKQEIELLLDQCFLMLNKYMSMFKAATWSRQIVGHDDYLSVFKFMRLGLEKFESDIQKEMDSFSLKP